VVLRGKPLACTRVPLTPADPLSLPFGEGDVPCLKRRAHLDQLSQPPRHDCVFSVSLPALPRSFPRYRIEGCPPFPCFYSSCGSSDAGSFLVNTCASILTGRSIWCFLLVPAAVQQGSPVSFCLVLVSFLTSAARSNCRCLLPFRSPMPWTSSCQGLFFFFVWGFCGRMDISRVLSFFPIAVWFGRGAGSEQWGRRSIRQLISAFPPFCESL